MITRPSGALLFGASLGFVCALVYIFVVSGKPIDVAALEPRAATA